MHVLRIVCWFMTILLCVFAAGRISDAAPTSPAEATVPVGVAESDITPDDPIRLTGYASRKTESEGIAQRLWAKALAIGGDEGDGPAVLMMVENCGVPGSLTAEVADRLKAKAGVKPERFVVCSTHTHAGPWLIGFAPALLVGTVAGRAPSPHGAVPTATWPTRWSRRHRRRSRRAGRRGWPGPKARCISP